MSPQEIQDSVKYWNDIIEKNMNHKTFILNPIVSSALMEIEKIQEKCPHEFSEHICKYCGKGE